MLQHLEGYIENVVYEVLADSEEDPQYSAVTVTNLIKCHIEVEEALDRQLPYHNVEEYLRDLCLTEEEMQVLENGESNLELNLSFTLKYGGEDHEYNAASNDDRTI